MGESGRSGVARGVLIKWLHKTFQTIPVNVDHETMKRQLFAYLLWLFDREEAEAAEDEIDADTEEAEETQDREEPEAAQGTEDREEAEATNDEIHADPEKAEETQGNAMVVSKNVSAEARDTKSMTQCAPWAFIKDVVTPLLGDEEMVNLVKEIMFDTLLDMQPIHPKKGLLQFMVDAFDIEARVFRINKDRIDIKKLMPKLVGLQNCGKDIVIDSSYDEHTNIRNLLTTNDKKSIAAKEGARLRSEEGLDKLSRCIIFILEACAYVLAPKSNRNLERSLLSIFKGVESLNDLKNMKWCDFFGDFLIDGIITFKNGGVKCHGFLSVVAPLLYDLVTPPHKIPDKGFPRVNHVTQAQLDSLDIDKLPELVKRATPLSQSIYYYQDSQVEARHDGSITTLLKEIDGSTADLVREFSAAPEEETKMIRDIMNARSTKSIKTKVACLEEQLKKQRTSFLDKTKQLQNLHKDLGAKFSSSSTAPGS